MPYILEDLVIDRVDLVNEGANSAAFIEVFKRKEQGNPMDISEILSKMKPEHAEVLQKKFDDDASEVSKLRADLEEATSKVSELEAQLGETSEELAKAKNTKYCECGGVINAEGTCEACGKSVSFDETEVLKSLPENLREEFLKMRSQKEAAEEQVRKAAEEKAEAEAVAKAATLKALPVEQSTLVDIVKSCDQRVIDVLTTVANAIDGVVLDEVGKSATKTVDANAWDKIEAEADKVAERDSITKQKAIAVVIKEKPELYREYLNGGAN